MGFDIGRLGLGVMTLGASELIPEDTRSRIPILGELTGAKSDEQKNLLKKQEEMAADVRKRQRFNERARMNAMGQKMLAFNPQNQMMAKMFGPEAAFTPEEFAKMGADPMADQEAAMQAWQRSMAGTQAGPNSSKSRTTMTPEEEDIWMRAKEDRERRAQIQQQMRAPGPGPAPLQQRAPAPARRY